MLNFIQRCINGGTNTFVVLNKIKIQQSRTRYINWKMRKDVKQRNTVVEYDSIRTRLIAIRKGKMLPEPIKDYAHKCFTELPADIRPSRTNNRCVLTSRPKGVVGTHRLSRIMWRLLADYNKMSGIIRAKW